MRRELVKDREFIGHEGARILKGLFYGSQGGAILEVQNAQ